MGPQRYHRGSGISMGTKLLGFWGPVGIRSEPRPFNVKGGGDNIHATSNNHTTPINVNRIVKGYPGAEERTKTLKHNARGWIGGIERGRGYTHFDFSELNAPGQLGTCL